MPASLELGVEAHATTTTTKLTWAERRNDRLKQLKRKVTKESECMDKCSYMCRRGGLPTGGEREQKCM